MPKSSILQLDNSYYMTLSRNINVAFHIHFYYFQNIYKILDHVIFVQPPISIRAQIYLRTLVFCRATNFLLRMQTFSSYQYSETLVLLHFLYKLSERYNSIL